MGGAKKDVGVRGPTAPDLVPLSPPAPEVRGWGSSRAGPSSGLPSPARPSVRRDPGLEEGKEGAVTADRGRPRQGRGVAEG